MRAVGIDEGVHQVVKPEGRAVRAAEHAVVARQTDHVRLCGDDLAQGIGQLVRGGGHGQAQLLKHAHVDEQLGALLVAYGLRELRDVVDFAVRHGDEGAEIADLLIGLLDVDRQLRVRVVVGQRDQRPGERPLIDGSVVEAVVADDDVRELVAALDHQVDLGLVVRRGVDHELDVAAQLRLQLEGHLVGVVVLDVDLVGDGDGELHRLVRQRKRRRAHEHERQKQAQGFLHGDTSLSVIEAVFVCRPCWLHYSFRRSRAAR